MSDISPISRPQQALLNQSSRASKSSESAASATRGSDSVELSSQARLLSKIKELPDIREDLISSIRAQIDAGQYETEERLDSAINSLIEDLD